MSPVRFFFYLLAVAGVIYALAVAVMMLCFFVAWLWRKVW